MGRLQSRYSVYRDGKPVVLTRNDPIFPASPCGSELPRIRCTQEGIASALPEDSQPLGKVGDHLFGGRFNILLHIESCIVYRL
jgi:hypothetical protein